MAESTTHRPWRPHHVNRACDSCYSRKVRCDRGDPCSNCAAGKVQCLRLRPKQSSSDRSNIEPELVNGLVARISQLEQSIQHTPTSATSVKETGAATQQRSETRGLKRRIQALDHHDLPSENGESDQRPFQRPQSSQPQAEVSDVASGTLQAAHQREACGVEDVAISHLDMQRYLRPRIATDLPIDSMLLQILDSALCLAKNFTASDGKTESLVEDASALLQKHATSVCPPLDFFDFMIKVAYRSPVTAAFFELHSCSLPDQLRDMAKQLFENTVDGEAKLHYMICVNYFAYLSLITTMFGHKDEAAPAYMEASAKKYCDIVMACLRVMDMHIRPDPMLLQALLTGAMLMQQLGCVRRCWEFKSIACRVCAVLSSRAGVSSPSRTNCHLNFLKCRVFNVSLTAINNQPASPVEFDAESSLLDSNVPSHAILMILVEFAKVQEAFIRDIRNPPDGEHHKQLKSSEMRELKPKMMQIKKKMERLRKEASPNNDEFLVLNWMFLEHIFHSMMTSITKLSGAYEDLEAYVECLVHARRTLSSLKIIIDRAAKPSPDALKCTLALSWILPLYSLRPLYCIFSNVILKSDTLDLKLMQDVAASLRSLASKECFASSVSKLFDSFLGLYDHFASKVIYAEEDFYSQTVEAQTRMGIPAEPMKTRQPSVAGQQTEQDGENGQAAGTRGEVDGATLRTNNMDMLTFDPQLFDQDAALELSFFDPILNPLDLDAFAAGLFS
ncbi:hypothetical protein BFJ63_vAg15095 [Fusarium oxysporum f. sp. narcissi]|uniref:Zn(2)-C6 fungal-type domain-containing protein n=1 Tax=Fusarium oxysporum f. sp. narcissi TaxID=451672 RepID=A0A4Q2VDE9_FUSOX|nr:hypothetical protein BFJ70_g10303 [Fusarium oxysporum]RYC82027.1 hypothetical protein BFJ63_vAg15095 [Fusarium oxysporum f. sp. narcissi]